MKVKLEKGFAKVEVSKGEWIICDSFNGEYSLMMVFKYHIFYEGKDLLDHQVRHVVARDEEEADKKMERYRKQLVKQGFMDFRYTNMGIELYTVIA